MVVYRLSERSLAQDSGSQLKHSSAGPRNHRFGLGAHGQFPMIAGIALIFAMAAFSIPLSKMPGQNVTQIIAGDNITVSPENGYGTVTINSTGVGANGIGDNNVTKIIAGENVNISPDNGYGDVTITAAGDNGGMPDMPDNNVTRIIAGDNVTISPENGYGDVTITAGGDNGIMPDNNVVQIVAGENVTISPDNGYGIVTITAAGDNGVVGYTEGAKVRRRTLQSIPSGVFTTLTWNIEARDTDDMFNPAVQDRLTCNTAGTYLFIVRGVFHPNENGRRVIEFYKDYVLHSSMGVHQDAIGYGYVMLTAVISLNSGGYVQVRVYQTSGVALDFLSIGAAFPVFEAQRIG